MRRITTAVRALLIAALAPTCADAVTFVLQRTYLGEVALDQFGFSVQGAGDVNGDGFTDFLIGANVNDAAAPGGGRAYLYLAGTAYPALPVLRYSGTVEGENAGSAVAGGADLDGDGYEDWAVGAPGLGASGVAPGRVYVFFGGAAPDSIPDLVLDGSVAGGEFGSSLVLVRDLDGDGYGDLVVGAPRAGNGTVSIFRGGPRPLDAMPDRVLHARANESRFGRSLACLPDRDGDGRDELLVGVPHSSEAATWAGSVLLYAGSADLDTIPDLTLLGEAAGDEFGTSVAAGVDVDGDGGLDILVGAPAANSGILVDVGKAYLFRGGAALDAIPDLTLTGVGAQDRFGSAVAMGFDWDGDGFPDLAAGAPDNDSGGLDAGSCSVFRGGPALDAVADTVLLGTAASTHLGTSVASPGEIRRNGSGALLVGGYSSGDAGQVLLLGSDLLPTDVAPQVQAAPAARLLAPWPNPSNPLVETRLDAGVAADWVVDVLDVRGRLVTRLLESRLAPGSHRIVWDGKDARGVRVASGVYRIRARSGGVVTSVAVTILR